jgi:predicted metal-dependent phosphoesterase TrpH
MAGATTSRADMHCHSAGMPPDEVYALAKRGGMDFVTITDHDSIEGVLEIADRPDVFVSVELCAWFRDAPQAVHVLCYGVTTYDHAWLQRHRHDLEVCAAYLREHSIACALAHPFHTVEAPLTARHRWRLAELFPVWETRNGAEARELNMQAALYVENRDGTGIGGSDDWAGARVGLTYTEAPHADTPLDFLAHVRAGLAMGRGGRGPGSGQPARQLVEHARPDVVVGPQALALRRDDAGLAQHLQVV